MAIDAARGRRIRRAIALIAVCCVLSAWTGHGLAFTREDGTRLAEACLEYPESVKDERAKVALKMQQAYGPLSIIELGGDYSRGLSGPRASVAREFYRHHRDEFDFLVVFTTFEFPTGDSRAFYNSLRNDVAGIGVPVHDVGASFGSASRLQGYIDMAAVTRYELRPASPGYAAQLAVLVHEMQHRWGVKLTYRDANGVDNASLLGKEGAHWSQLVDTDASIMYGADWAEYAPGQFRAIAARHRLSRWDLYLAGWVDASEVSPLRIIRGSSLDPFGVGEVGTEATGHIETVTISQVRASLGERIPDASRSQRRFRAGLVLLTRPGESVSPQLQEQIVRYAGDAARYFQTITEGRAALAIGPAQTGDLAAIEPPQGLEGSLPANHQDPLADARAWLEQQQQADGRFQDHPRSALRDTAIAFMALNRVGPTAGSSQAAARYLDAQRAIDADAAFWRHQAGFALSESEQRLLASAGPGGVALASEWQSGTLDSLLALQAVIGSPVPSPGQFADLSEYLRQRQSGDGGLAIVPGGPSELRPTILAASLWLHSSDPALVEAGGRARDWVNAQVERLGTAELPPLEVAELLATAHTLGLQTDVRQELRQQLLRSQGGAGDWRGSVFTTSRVLLALAEGEQANLVASQATSMPDPISPGMPVELRVKIANDGGIPSAPSQVQWYLDAAPEQGGAPLGSPVDLAALLPGESRFLGLRIDSTSLSGHSALLAWVDAAQQVAERQEDDNRSELHLNWRSSPQAADPALFASDVTLSPTHFEHIGQRIAVTGVVRNLGSLAVASVPLRLTRDTALLAETHLDLAPASQTAFELGFDLDRLDEQQLELRLDADGSLAEADESNNVLMLMLRRHESIDLAIAAENIDVSPAEPVVGHDVRVVATVRNNGTQDAGNTRVELQRRTESGEWLGLSETSILVPGGSSATREFSWRADTAGDVPLRVVVDPDNVLAELSEDNNIAESTIRVLPDERADLRLLPGTLQPVTSPVKQGQPLSMTVGLRNAGGGNAAAFDVALYLGDPVAQGHLLARTRIEGGLATQTETLVNLDVADLPSAGEIVMFAVADVAQEIAESDEDNNRAIHEDYALSLPNLAVSPTSIRIAPPIWVPGQPMTVEVDVVNLGEQEAPASDAHLYAVAGSQRSEIQPAASVPGLAAGASATVNWNFEPEAGLAVDGLSVVVDESNTLREHQEIDNSASLPLQQQSDEAFSSEPFFSPNDDGIRDRTHVYFADPEQRIIRVRVVNAWQREVRVLAEDLQHGNGRTIVQWDGRESGGQVAADGTYRLQAVSHAGEALSTVEVTLDIDRPDALDSVNSERGVLQALPSSYRHPVRPREGRTGDDYVYSAGAGLDPIVRTGVLLGDEKVVLSRAWLDRWMARNAVQRANIGGLDVDQDSGKLVFVLAADADVDTSHYSVWVQSPTETDQPMQLTEFTGVRNSVGLLGQFDGRRFMLSVDGDAVLIDLSTGETRALPATEALPIWVEQRYAEGTLVATIGRNEDVGNEQARGYQFYPASDPAHPLAPIDIAYPNCFAEIATDPVRPRLLLHRRSSDREWIDLVDLASGESQTLRDLVLERQSDCFGTAMPDGNGKGDARPGAGRASKMFSNGDDANLLLRAYWTHGGQAIQLVDHSLGELRMLDASGVISRIVTLPALGRRGNYQPFDNDGLLESPEVVLGELAEESRYCPDPWFSGGNGPGRPGMIPPARYREADGSDFILQGEVVSACNGATQLLRIAGDARITELGRLSRWELEEAEDVERFRLQQDPLDLQTVPGAWPVFIQRGGASLRYDGRVEWPDGRRSAIWQHPGRIVGAWPSGARLDLRDDREDFPERLVFSSLDRLSGVLNAESLGRGIRLSGLASDRNFESFRIDFASTSSPDEWKVLVPATSGEVLFDDFMTWAPPAVGAYLFRLTVQDRAGNAITRFASASSQYASPVSSLRQNLRAMSPNGDAVQDAFVLDYRIDRPAEIVFAIVNEAGGVVLQQTRNYGSLEIGPQSWSWDGRDDRGLAVPDGTYRVRLSVGFELKVVVDSTAPSIDVSAPPSYPPQEIRFAETTTRIDISVDHSEFEFIGYEILTCVDDKVGAERGPSVEIELQARDMGSVEWRHVAHIDRCSSAAGNDADPIRSVVNFEDYVGRQYRVVATDPAGNRREHVLREPAPLLALVAAGSMPPSELREWQPLDSPSAVTRDVPFHRYSLNGGSNWAPSDSSGQLWPEVIPGWANSRTLPVRGVPIYFLSSTEPGDAEVLVDLAEMIDGAPDAPLQWRTISISRSVRYWGSVQLVRVDLSEYPGQPLALRIRERNTDGSVNESNAFAFGGANITASCIKPNAVGCSGFGVIFDPDPAVKSMQILLGNQVPPLSLQPTQVHGGPAGSPALYEGSCPLMTDQPGALGFAFGVPPLALLDASDGRAVLSITQAGSSEALTRELKLELCPGANELPVLQVIPEFGAECEARPTERVRLRPAMLDSRGRRADIQVGEYRIKRHARSGADVVVAEGRLDDVAADGFTMSTTGLPSGDIELTLEYRRPGSTDWRRSDQPTHFPVDRTPPLARLDAPAAGGRFCAGDPGVRVEGAAASDTALEFRIAASGTRQLRCSYGATVALDGLSEGDPSQRNWSGSPTDCMDRLPSLRTSPDNASTSGWLTTLGGRGSSAIDAPSTIRLSVADWSGAVVCADSTVDLDMRARFFQRSPAQGEPAHLVGRDGLLLSTRSDASARRLHWPLRAAEPMSIRVIVAEAIEQADGGYMAGATRLQLYQQHIDTGDFDVEWDAASAPLPDGRYLVIARAEDSCGNTIEHEQGVALDSIAPTIDLAAPPPDAEVPAMTLSLLAAMRDEHFEKYVVEVAADADGPWLELGRGDAPSDQPRVVAQWDARGQLGEHWWRVRARDRLGNEGVAARRIVLGEDGRVLAAVSGDPTLFSPNDDGVLDATRIDVQLLRPALITARVHGRDGEVLHVFADSQPHPAGNLSWVWDGSASGPALADGDYAIRVEARDAEGGSDVESAEVLVGIDRTSPGITGLRPNNAGFAPCGASVEFDVDDHNLQRVEAWLSDTEDQVVASLVDLANGHYRLATLGDAEDSGYQFRLQARDLAGNLTEVQRGWDLDCAPPMAVLDEIEDTRVLRGDGAQAFEIRGTASDDHLANYRLALVDESDASARIEVGSGSAVVEAGLLWSAPLQAPDGEYVLELDVEDQAGNVASANTLVTVDSTPPLVQIQEPDDGSAVGGSFSIVGSAGDMHFSHYRVEYASAEDAASGNWTTLAAGNAPVDEDVLAHVQLGREGLFRVRLVAVDRAGLQSSHEIGLRVDATAPSAPISLVADVQPISDVHLQWQGGGTPDLRGFVIYRDGSPLNADLPTARRDWLDSAVGDGEWRYRVTAVDAVGNESGPSNEVRVRVDRSAPEVALTEPGEGSRVRGVVEITGTAYSQGDFGEFRLSRGDAVTGAEATLRAGAEPQRNARLAELDTRAFAEGTSLRLRLWAIDASGNEAEVLRSFLVDNLAPAAPTGLAIVQDSGNLLVHWSPGNEPDLLGYLLYRNGVLVSGQVNGSDLRGLALADNQWLDAGPPDGALVYQVHAIDQAGNLSPPSEPASIELDQRAPHLYFVRPRADHVFERPLELLARTVDLDVAQAEFSFRAANDSEWTPLAGTANSAPWRSRFDPAAAGLAYGSYELRVVATDAGGLVDPSPEVIGVHFRDLTAPSPVKNLQVRSDGNDVLLEWDAVADGDLAGYLVDRLDGGGWQPLQAVPQGDPYLTDPGRAIGEWTYRVRAVDGAGNESEPSASAIAHVIQPRFAPLPRTPTADGTVELEVVGAERPGSAVIGVSNADGAHEVAQGRLEARQERRLTPIELLPGANAFELRVIDDEGNRSVVARTELMRGTRPPPPEDVSARVDAEAVRLSWSASPGADLAGYRLYRDGFAVMPDVDIEDVSASALDPDQDVLDGNMATTWRLRALPLTDRLDGDIELEWPVSALVGSVTLEWPSVADSARDFEIDGWFQGRWNSLVRVEDNSQSYRIVNFDDAYPTDRLRIRPLRAQAYGAEQRLAEVVVRRRSLIESENAVDVPAEGRRRFAVAAVDALGFQGAMSIEAAVEVGDVEPPPSVQLQGQVQGASIFLSWTSAAAEDLDRYRLLRDGVAIAEMGADAAREYLDAHPGLGTHRYQVFAVDRIGNMSPPSNELVLEIEGELPGAPQWLALEQTDSDPGGFDLRWQAGGGPIPIAYRVESSHREDGVGDAFRLLARVTEPHFVHRPLQFGERVYYRIQAEDGEGNVGPYSEVRGAKMVDLRAPATPVLSSPTQPGRTLQWYLPDADVCGLADPAALVSLLRNGGDTAKVGVARESERVLVFYPDSAVYDALAWPDGSHLLLTTESSGGWLPLDAGSDTGFADLVGSLDLQVALEQDWGVGLRAGEAFEFYVDDQSSATVSTGLDRIDLLAPAPLLYESPWLLVGESAGSQGVWLYDYGREELLALAFEGDPALIEAVRWTSDGGMAHLLMADGRVEQLRLSDRSWSTVIAAHAQPGVFERSPVDDALLFVEASGADTSVRVMQLQGGLRTLTSLREPVLAAAWAPDASQIALRLADRIDFLAADDGRLLRSIAMADGVGDQRMRWSAAWDLVVYQRGAMAPVRVIRPEGAFCVRGVVVQPGPNAFVAFAKGENGLQSPRSGPVNLVSDAILPNLKLSSGDLQVVPSFALPGSRFSALVTTWLAAGEDTLPEIEASAVLVTPGGARVAVEGLSPLDGFGQASPSADSRLLDLGVLNEPGLYRLEVSVDPDNRIGESQEHDNFASAEFVVGDSRLPQIHLGADQAEAAPGETLSGDLLVSGVTPPGATITLLIEDASGRRVAELLRQADPAPMANAPMRRRWEWRPSVADSAGVYRAHAVLHDSTGSVLDEETLVMRVRLRQQLELLLRSSRSQLQVGTPISIQVGIDVSHGSHPVAPGTLVLTVEDAAGVTKQLARIATGSLLAGYRVRRTIDWPVEPMAVGELRLRLRFESPGIDQTIERLLQLEPDDQAILGGSLEASPQSRLVLGDSEAPRLSYRVESGSSKSIDNVEARVTVRAEAGGEPLLHEARHGSAGGGQVVSGELPLDTLPHTPQNFSAELRARVADGPWQLLDQLALSRVDALPPEIFPASPLERRPQRSPLLLSARIVDRHSPVQAAHYRIDGGSWQPLPGRAQQFEALLDDLADGSHTFAIDAVDSWGNLRELAPIAFEVDSTPPTLSWNGIEANARVNAVVRPQVMQDDAHPDQLGLWLDGALFRSGNDVVSEGRHRLQAIAVDRAGNRAESVLDFEIDLTPPPLRFVDPSDGTRIADPRVPVVLASEAGARIELRCGGWSATRFVDGDGLARFDAVPLQPGTNNLQANASDAAGNEARAVLALQYVAADGLIGSLTPPAASHPHGRVLAVAVNVRNGTLARLAALPLRIGVDTPDAATRWLWNGAPDIESGQAFVVTLNLETGAWPRGTSILRLDAEVEGHWQQLDAVGVQLIDATAPDLDIDSPQQGAILRSPVVMSGRATDDLPGIAAELRMGSGDWLPLALTADGHWQRQFDFDDGVYSLSVRAEDAAGNASAAPVRGFEVDSTPPQIVVEGVADGGLYGEPITVRVAVLDRHPGRVSIRLNEQNLVSGTMIDRSGVYRVEIDAEDGAGNTASRQLDFELDLDLPPLELTAPAPGAVVPTAQVGVVGRTAAGASVEIVGPGGSVTALADSEGRFAIDDMPLIAGDNLLSARATDRLRRSSAAVERHVVFDPQSVREIEGRLQLVPRDLVLGEQVRIAHAVDERGGIDRVPLALRLLVQRLGGDAIIDRREWAANLAAHGHVEGALTVAASGWQRGTYQVHLEAQIASHWTRLATASVVARDATAPVPRFVYPLADSFVPGDIAPRVEVADAHGSVDAVDLRTTGGGWQRMLAVVPGVWTMDLRGLPEGEVTLEARASDDSGNMSAPIEQSFHVDRTPPQIDVTGIDGGGHYRDAITAGIAVSDASPVQSVIHMDGEDYSSGQTLADEGPHELHVVSVDAAGNRSERRVAFELDFTPPELMIIAPVSGATLRSSWIDLIGRTEPLLRVDVGAGSEVRELRSDIHGDFVAAALPLVKGNNRLRVRATDRAGNTGGWVEVEVTREGDGGLRGQLSAPSAIAPHHDLPVTVGLRNESATDIAPADVRVEIEFGDGRTEVLDTRSQALAAGTSIEYSFHADTTGYPLGPAVLRLMVEMDGDLQLGSRLIRIDAQAQTPRGPAAIPARSPWVLALAVIMLLAGAWIHLQRSERRA